MNFALFSDSFGFIMRKQHGDIPFFCCYVKEILLSSLCKKKSEKFLENNFVYGQISKILLKFLLNPCDTLKLIFFLNSEFNKLKT